VAAGVLRCKALRSGVRLIRDATRHTPLSTHAHRLHLEECRDFFNLFGDVTYPNRAVMRRTVPIPGIHEISDIERKFIATISIADLQDGAGY
jgi:hypothetical protein